MSSTNEKFCLKWNDFQQNITESYYDLRKEEDFSDVTLVCGEDQQFKAHRIILSACSPLFNKMLKRNNHSHPIIYMRGILAKELEAILDFIYQGETNIYQEDLDGFLSLANDLQLKGLTGSATNVPQEIIKPTQKFIPTLKTEPEVNIPWPDQVEHLADEDFTEYSIGNKSLVPAEPSRMKTKVADNSSIESLEKQIDSMIVNTSEGGARFKCIVCGKSDKHKIFMVRHVETHIEGIQYPCDQCGKISRSKNGLNLHVSRHHKTMDT